MPQLQYGTFRLFAPCKPLDCDFSRHFAVFRHTLTRLNPLPETVDRSVNIWDYPFFVAFMLGLVSTLHCVGMCGGIMGMMTMSLPQPVRNAKGRLLLYTLGYNLGRVGSYVLAGLLAGLLGDALVQDDPAGGPSLLRALFSMLVILMGLYLAGWFPRLTLLEHLGKPLWRLLEPLGRRLLPVHSPSQAMAFGMVWGWLPCSPVYSSLVLSLTTGSAANGALFMLGFGLGTLPTLVATGYLAGFSTHLRRMRYLGQFAGTALAIMGLVGLLLALWPHEHGHHAPPQQDVPEHHHQL